MLKEPPEQHTIRPSILYFGTPVSLISTLNPDGSANLSPMSSSWALGDRIVLGMATTGRGFLNIEQRRECVINMPSPDIWEAVERIAATTGLDPLPEYKREMGYGFEPRKFERAGLTPLCCGGAAAGSRVSASIRGESARDSSRHAGR